MKSKLISNFGLKINFWKKWQLKLWLMMTWCDFSVIICNVTLCNVWLIFENRNITIMLRKDTIYIPSFKMITFKNKLVGIKLMQFIFTIFTASWSEYFAQWTQCCYVQSFIAIIISIHPSNSKLKLLNEGTNCTQKIAHFARILFFEKELHIEHL
jgi:hypothetical protein